MGKKLPYIPIYPGDWLRAFTGCTLAAQALYLRFEFIGHDSERYGYLSQNGSPIPPDTLAQRTGCASREQYDALLSELDGVPLLLGRTPDGTIIVKRLVDLQRRRREAKRIGSKGGNPKLLEERKTGRVNPPVNPPLNMTMKMSSSGDGEAGEGDERRKRIDRIKADAKRGGVQP